MLRGQFSVLGRRLAHTRPKKVKVQLLKDIPPWGQRGEVLHVSEGLMRNKLHSHGAYYVLPGEELRIPLRKRVHRHHRETVKVAEETDVAEKPAETSEKPSLLDLLQFPSGPGQQAKASPQTPVDAKPATENSVAAAPLHEKDGERKFEWMNEFVTKATKHKN